MRRVAARPQAGTRALRVAGVAGGLALLAAPVGSAHAAGAAPAARRHDVYVSHTRMVVEARTVVCRVRLFKDDLELALQRHSGRPELRVAPGAAAESLFASYAAGRLAVAADGARLPARVVASGEEREPGGETVVWFMVRFEAPRPVGRVTLRNALLFDVLGDQQNIVALLRLPGDRRQSFYFVAGGPAEQTATP